MSRGFVKDGDQEDVPVVPQRAFLPSGMVNYVTREGMDALLHEKDGLISERDGLTGNETDVRVSHNFINAKLVLLEERIRSAVVMEAWKQPADKVAIGAYVTLRMGGNGATRTVRITGADESDARKGFISYFSPLASALAGHKVGERVEVAFPSGTKKVTIVSISYMAASDTDGNVGNAASGKELPSANNPEMNASTSQAPIASAPETDSATIATAQAFGESSSPASAASVSAAIAPAHPHKKQKPATEDANEVFPLVNERGITIGRAARWQCHNGGKLLHPVVHLHLFNSRGELYLQKRPDWKDIQPGKWDTSVGGHIGFGEKVEDALKREVREELGIEDFEPVFIKRYVFESAREKELVNVYRTVYDGAIHPSDELDGGRFWSREEILENIGRKVFTPNFESEYKLFNSGAGGLCLSK